MKIVDKENLKKLIDDIVIESFNVIEPLSTPIDTTTLDRGVEHMLNRQGTVKIVIEGRVKFPNEQL